MKVPKKATGKIAWLAAIGLILSACASAPEASAPAPAPAAAPVEVITLDFSTQSVPDDHHTQAIVKFAELVSESTNGRLQITVHHSGSLMDQNTEQDAIQRGDVDMVYTSPQWIQGQVPAVGLLGVPYMIANLDHLYAVHDSDIGQELYDLVVQELGIRPLTSMYLGARQLNLAASVKKIDTPADMAGVNLRVPDADAWIEMGKALGANPTPVAFGELYLALETGTVDGQDNPLSTTINASFYEVTGQVALTNHLINDVWPTINEKTWQSLDADLQAAIVDAWKEARSFGTDIALANEAKAVAFLEAAGLEVYTPNVSAFREHVLGIYLGDASRVAQWIPGMLEKVQALASS
jgi:tripartite ATP-independent transporter DctP family solute receptor